MPTTLNGAPGAMIVGLEDGHDTAITFLVGDQGITRIYAVRNPTKLRRDRRGGDASSLGGR